MKAVSASEAQAQLERLMDQVTESHEPIVILSEPQAVVLIAVEDWYAIQHILRRQAIP